jgi:hypothetical protein
VQWGQFLCHMTSLVWLVVVNELDLLWTFSGPGEVNAELIVHADGILPLAVAFRASR